MSYPKRLTDIYGTVPKFKTAGEIPEGFEYWSGQDDHACSTCNYIKCCCLERRREAEMKEKKKKSSVRARVWKRKAEERKRAKVELDKLQDEAAAAYARGWRRHPKKPAWILRMTSPAGGDSEVWVDERHVAEVGLDKALRAAESQVVAKGYRLEM